MMDRLKKLKERYQDLLAEYGTIALVVWFVVFFVEWGVLWWAISAGFEVDGATGQVGTVWAAYAGTQLTKPLRIGLTLFLTPLVARALHRFRPPSHPSPEPTIPEERTE